MVPESMFITTGQNEGWVTQQKYIATLGKVIQRVHLWRHVWSSGSGYVLVFRNHIELCSHLHSSAQSKWAELVVVLTLFLKGALTFTHRTVCLHSELHADFSHCPHLLSGGYALMLQERLQHSCHHVTSVLTLPRWQAELYTKSIHAGLFQ